MRRLFSSCPIKGLKMFKKIETAMIKVLQDHLKTVPKDNIGVKITELGENLPAISITNIDFEVQDVGVGRSIGGEGRELQDMFSGDGKTKEFTVKVKPLRPTITVEHPIGTRLTEDDYAVNYEKGVITFKSPPEKGKENILVKYLKPIEIKGLRFNLRYHLNIWAGDEAQRDAITVEVMETLLREEDTLNWQGISIKPVKGFNIPPNEDLPGETYGKTIEYSTEAELRVVVPYPRMEKIEIKRA